MPPQMLKKCRTASHRPAVKRRRFRHDEVTAVDLFSGFGGLTKGLKEAGVTTIMAANHDDYKVAVHEANHPEAERWIADLVDPEAADYHSARDLPPADFLAAGVSCVNHSQANTIKAYEQGAALFELDDPDYEARVTRSERDRATANCVLHYAAQHHPRLILVECTTELTSWGPAIPGSRKIGDGSTYRWWLKQFDLLNYDQALYGHYRGKSALAALLLRFDLATGGIEVVDAGSPTLWRIRGSTTERVELDRQLPLGMFEDTVYAMQRLRLLPGDRSVFVACDPGEPRSAGDGEAGDGPVARALAQARHLSCADAPRAVVRALREASPGAPESVLVVCLDWHGPETGRPGAATPGDGGPLPPPGTP
ncbi:SpoIIE family protein phosphatase [Streptomyces sp. NPDC051079]|uniref:SpoIIE family protein phosphatase n=1 Tax=Streptomyces sp. NPDC051079 TaxID=3155043 RepID=UPI00344CF9A3